MKHRFLLIITTVLANFATCFVSNGQLKVVKDIPLPGGANRFDYQSINAANRRLYISHMNSSAVVVFDLDGQKVIANIENISRPTGVLAVPALGKVYVSASHANEVVVIDERTLKITNRIPSGGFPDGIAFDPVHKRIYVSDEHGKQVTVIDALTDKFITNIEMGGEVGNTHYDPVSHKIFSAVQTKNQLVCIDPAANKVMNRFDLKGCDEPHGFYIDAGTHYALITGEGKGEFVVFDLGSNKIIYAGKAGKDPDVLAFDEAHHRLYVSSESGIISIFSIEKGTVTKIAEEFVAKHAHTISVDPKTHLLYLSLESENGKPVLRVMEMK